MSIAPLSLSTARILTASVALNDAVSVVKELVDNALDAAASTITIEISTNTIDIIQVKDNGRGIGIEDRQLLCKKGCTSKIRTIDDLNTLGGRSLGFRGEALASMANSSDAVIVTTKIEGEGVGTALKFGANGKIISSSSTSHAVGTTVRVQNFLSNVPVRKQTVMKTTTKILANVRKMLFTYAFARPEVRFTFKVLKAKNDKMNWSYAPTLGAASMIEHAIKLIGKEAASQTTLVSRREGDNEGYSLDVLLIRPGSDVQKACNIDSYVSVDQRPVSTDRDVLKDLQKLYKKYLRNNLPDHDVSISKPFLSLRLSCPSESYDINIEPAKDRVMFYDEKIIYNLFEEMMKSTYGELRNTAETPASRLNKHAETADFNILLASPRATSPVRPDVRRVPGMEEGSAPHTGASHFDMRQEATNETSDRDDRVQDDPFTKARMNVRIAPRVSENEGLTYVREREGLNQDTKDSATSTVKSPYRTSVESEDQLLTPERSPERSQEPYQNPGPPPRRRHPPSSDESELDSPPQVTPPGPTLLDGWMRAAQQIRPDNDRPALMTSQVTNTVLSEGSTSTTPLPNTIMQEHSVSRRSLQTNDTRRGNNHSTQKPFKTPFMRPRPSQFPSSPASSQISDCIERLESANMVRPGPTLDNAEDERELDEIMQFERNKRLVSQQRQRSIKEYEKLQHRRLLAPPVAYEASSQAGSEVTSSEMFEEDFASQFEDDATDNARVQRQPLQHSELPHVALLPRRPVSARSSAVEDQDMNNASTLDRLDSENSAYGRRLPDSDPRAHLIRQRELAEQQAASSTGGLTKTGLKVRRVQTTRLPFESIPQGQELHELSISMAVAPDGENCPADNVLKRLVEQSVDLQAVDEYIISGGVKTMDWSTCEAGQVEDWSHVVVAALKKLCPEVQDGDACVFDEVATSMRLALQA